MKKIVQHVFTEKNVKKYFLLPYVSIKLDGNTVFIGNSHISDDAYELNNHNNWAVEMLLKLRDGIDENQLKQIIADNTGEESEDWIAFFVQGGIIE